MTRVQFKTAWFSMRNNFLSWIQKVWNFMNTVCSRQIHIFAIKYMHKQTGLTNNCMLLTCQWENEYQHGEDWCPVRSVYSHGHIHPETEWEAWQPNIRHVYLYPPPVLRHWLCICFSWGLVLSYLSHSLTIFCWYKAELSVIIGWQREKYCEWEYECMCVCLFDKCIR